MTSAKGRHERAIAIHKALPVNEDGTTKIVEIVFHSPPEVILKLGLFFDGTKNNAINTTHRKNYQLRLLNNENAQTDLPVHDLSYENEYTNIYKLYEMYYFDEKLSLAPKEDGLIYYQEGIYLEGVGTIDGKADDDLSAATGLIGPGIGNKVLIAINKINEVISKFKRENQGIRIKEIQYEIFGFSRGAATARVFTNLVQDPKLFMTYFYEKTHSPTFPIYPEHARQGKKPLKHYNPLTHMLDAALDGIKAGLWKDHPNGKINFLGLFDTVAGLCHVTNGFDAGNGDYFGFDIPLNENCAKHGIQIQAQHEYRENFSLDDVPDSFTKITLPGSHSDIGGGYLNYPHQEKVCIAKYRLKNLLKNKEILSEIIEKDIETFKNCKKIMKIGLRKDIACLQSHPDTKYLFSQLNDNHIETWGWSGFEFRGALVSCRIIKPGLDRIALRVMYNEAISKGCRFHGFNTDYSVPAELNSLSNNIIDFAKNGITYELTEEEKKCVSEYIHCSVNFERDEIKIQKEIPILDETAQTGKTIKWMVKEPEDKTDFDPFIQPHVPRYDAQGHWFRKINPNRR